VCVPLVERVFFEYDVYLEFQGRLVFLTVAHVNVDLLQLQIFRIDWTCGYRMGIGSDERLCLRLGLGTGTCSLYIASMAAEWEGFN
jgi:hypothetical protein